MGRSSFSFLACAVAFSVVAVQPVTALDSVDLSVVTADSADLQKTLTAASLLRAALADKMTDPQDVLSVALSDYTRLLETLYANGYYSGQISIKLDGREAALIEPLDPLPSVTRVTITVDPGGPFRFGRAEVAPLVPGARLPEGFRTGASARAEQVSGAVDQAITDWRAAGHAKADVADQQIVADHAARRLDARVALSPGPLVRFGALNVMPGSKVTTRKVLKIAGLPEGEVFSPADLDKAALRLRRTGAFRSVQLSEAEALNPDNSMDITAQLVDEKPRRIGAGVELSNYDGLALSAFWMHRNLRGGAERFRVEGEVRGIGGQTGGTDYRLGARLDAPGSFGPDTSIWLEGEVEHLDEPDYKTDRARLAIGAHRIFSETFSGDLGFALEHERADDAFGKRDFTLFAMPFAANWDRRDDLLDPTKGFYIRAGATPFLALQGTENGARFTLDARAYQGLGGDDGRIVLAGRMQAGALFGPDLDRAPPRYLFYSGGGGTVRGQPYQSLGVDQGGGLTSGGRSFLGLSGEVRAKVTDTISLVGFADTGYIGASEFPDGSGRWHSGAGLGLRYDTIVGPIRFDVAAPVRGDTGDGVQFYIGIGQSF